MVFSSLAFLFIFFPIFLVSYFGVLALFNNKTGTKAITALNLILLAFSLFFYYWGEPSYIVFMLGSIVVNYVSGLLIYAVPSASSKKWALTSGILFNVALLFVAKYFTFFYAQAKLVWHKLPNSLPMGLTFGSHHWSGDLLKLALPIGISFYTFQSISYLIDVYRGQPVQKIPSIWLCIFRCFHN